MRMTEERGAWWGRDAVRRGKCSLEDKLVEMGTAPQPL